MMCIWRFFRTQFQNLKKSAQLFQDSTTSILVIHRNRRQKLVSVQSREVQQQTQTIIIITAPPPNFFLRTKNPGITQATHLGTRLRSNAKREKANTRSYKMGGEGEAWLHLSRIYKMKPKRMYTSGVQKYSKVSKYTLYLRRMILCAHGTG